MIPDKEIKMTRARLDELVPNLMARAEIQHLLAERELLVAEHGAGTLIRKDLDYNYLTPEFKAHDEAWEAVEAFS